MSEESGSNKLVEEITKIRTILETSNFQGQINKIVEKVTQVDLDINSIKSKMSLLIVLLPFLLTLVGTSLNYWIMVSPLSHRLENLDNKIQKIQLQIEALK
jgi:hypothetical protein